MLQIHQRIRQERERRNISQEELASKLGIKRSTYAYWEEVDPKPEKVKQVAKAMDLPDNFFFVNVEYEEDEQSAKLPSTTLIQAVLNLTESNRILAESNHIWAANHRELILIIKSNLNVPAELIPGSQEGSELKSDPVEYMGGLLDIKGNDLTLEKRNKKGSVAGKGKPRS